MTDREIDALIAEKVMGFNVGICLGENACIVCQYKLDWGCNHQFTPIKYSTDIAAAWEVVKTLHGKECRVIITHFPEWEVNALGAELPGEVNVRLISLSVQHPLNSSAWADSVPMAICLASLRAVEAEVLV